MLLSFHSPRRRRPCSTPWRPNAGCRYVGVERGAGTLHCITVLTHTLSLTRSFSPLFPPPGRRTSTTAFRSGPARTWSWATLSRPTRWRYPKSYSFRTCGVEIEEKEEEDKEAGRQLEKLWKKKKKKIKEMVAQSTQRNTHQRSNTHMYMYKRPWCVVLFLRGVLADFRIFAQSRCCRLPLSWGPNPISLFLLCVCPLPPPTLCLATHTQGRQHAPQHGHHSVARGAMGFFSLPLTWRPFPSPHPS